MRILVVGCNHKTAPLAIRERIAFDAEAAAAAVAALARQYPHTETLLVSTCNRVELYVARPAHARPQPEDLIEFIAARHGMTLAELAPAFYHHYDRDAVEHLMHVVSSLDSMVLGETQILGQVRAAFDQARQAKVVGPVLTRLFQDALATGKRVHTETELSAGRLSVASVAVQFAEQIFSDFADKAVLIVGAGEMGEQTLERLIELGPREVLVTNRSRPRADDLAARYRGRVIDFDRLHDALTQADIVISSTGATEPIIGAALVRGVMKARRYRPLFLIDIAVPRDIDSFVGRIEHVYLYNIDDLQKVVESTLDGRAAHVSTAEAILAQQVNGYLAWLRARALGPTIAALCKRLADLRAEELDWLMPKLAGASDRDRDLIDQMTHRLVRKVLHDPVEQLTAACDPQATMVDVLAQTVIRLFNLKIEEEDGPEGPAAEPEPAANAAASPAAGPAPRGEPQPAPKPAAAANVDPPANPPPTTGS